MARISFYSLNKRVAHLYSVLGFGAFSTEMAVTLAGVLEFGSRFIDASSGVG